MVSRKPTILVIDDVPENIDVLRGILEEDYFIKACLNGTAGLKIAQAHEPPDLILLDIMMPGMDGYEVCRRLKSNQKTEKIPVIFVTAKNDKIDEEHGFRAGAVDYITKPVHPSLVKARVKTHLSLYNQNLALEKLVQDRTSRLKDALEKIRIFSVDTIYRLSRASEFKDEDTGAHIQRMSHFSAALARELGMDKKSVEAILYASPMHDIGKIGVPDRILLKPAFLDDEEWKIMRRHTIIGGKILEKADSQYMKMAEIIAMTHHEKYDGTGYPNGLSRDGIPIEGRIVAVADVFDALTSQRPYKPPFSIKKSSRILHEGRGTHFDPKVLDAFFSILDEILSIKERFKDNK